ncbi:hypothetical protein ANCCEY_05028 [Ancylostoma ceylanicum]|uniref:Uncharacterized protein n=1 Tax=Ancylostoma ceylanicum TaxID=53326 RepID=A0A0D6LXE9_9BILA|nr:hypothetical protein ANCCEY_05028 [Ancylostoma ceylanicum]
MEFALDFRQSSANKAFIASIPSGDYEVVHPFQIRDKNERIGIDTRNYFLKAAEHYQHVTIVIRSNAAGRIKLVLERNNFIFLNRTSFRKGMPPDIEARAATSEGWLFGDKLCHQCLTSVVS